MSITRRVYIAGPISNGHAAKPRDIYANVRRACEYYEALIQHGFTPFCPHLSYFAWLDFKEDVHWPRWIELDLDFIDTCDVLLRIPGASKGADMEVKYAEEKNIPVIYTTSIFDSITFLECFLGKPKPRPELEKYLKMITDYQGP